MREIKFRAWDGENMWDTINWMSFNDSFVSTIEGHVRGGAKGSLSGTEISAVMQYTGLTDKNGLEIWEGDIVEQKNGIDMVLGIYEIRWGHFGFQMFDYSDPEKTNNYVTTTMLEVIGNIYENPEQAPAALSPQKRPKPADTHVATQSKDSEEK